MKIGIITWVHYENYGTKLQAIALQHYLKKLGHHVELINFQLPDVENKHNSPNKLSFIQKGINRLNHIAFLEIQKRNISSFEERTKKFEDVISDNCVLTDEVICDDDYVSICNSFDTLIFGSDQIWNPKWFHQYYYADFDEITSMRVAYAPSFGVNYVPQLQIDDYKRSLSRFNFLSAREEDGCKIIRDITDCFSTCVVDPTLLLDKKSWTSILTSERVFDEPYVLCYFLTDNKNHWKAAQRYANAHGYRVIIIPQQLKSYLQQGIIEKAAGVDDFINLIKDAECVFTDSFHATVFSVIFEKMFYVFERNRPNGFLNQNSRIYNLLGKLGLSDAIIKYNSSNIEKIFSPNYSDANVKLEELVNSSKNYLNTALSENETMASDISYNK